MRTPRATERRVRRNAALAGLRFTVSAVLALLVTPYALRVLGTEQFGIWAIAGGVLVAIRLLDLGLKGALTREVASAGSGRARATLAAALTMALVTGAGALVIVAALALPIIGFLRIPEDLQTVAFIALVGTAGVGAIENLFAPHAAALDGAGRADISSGIDTLQRVASALGVVGVLAVGWGLPGLVLKNAVLALAAGVAYRVCLGRAFPPLARTGPMRDWPRVRGLLDFGRHVQAVNLSALVIDPLGKVFLGRFAGLDAVSAYELAAMVASQVSGAFMAVAQIVFPESARVRARSDPRRTTARLLELWRRAERAIAVPATGAFVILAALAQPFVDAWLGRPYGTVGTILGLLCVGWLVAIAALPASIVAQGGGAEGVSTRGALTTSAIGVAGALLLAAPAGAIGVAAARSAGLTLGGAGAWLALARRWGRPMPRVRAIAGPVACALAAAAVARAVTATVGGGLVAVVLVGGACFAGYVLVSIGFGWLPEIRRDTQKRRHADGAGPGSAAAAVDTPTAVDSRAHARRLRPVAALIPAWNARDRITSVLESVGPQVDLALVVDNGSEDGTADLVESLGRAVIVIRRSYNDGYAAAINEGMARALELGAGSVLWLNDDVVVEDGAVASLLDALAARADAAAVSARLVYMDRPSVLNGTGGSWRANRSWAALRGDGEPDLGQYDGAMDPDYPSGAASLVGVDAWIDVGPMDESWFLYYEDVDWGLRAALRGWRTAYAPGARARHSGSLGTRADPARRRYYNVRNRLRFARQYAPTSGRIWVLGATSVLLVKQTVRLLFPTRRRDAEAVMVAVADQLRGVTGRSSRFA